MNKNTTVKHLSIFFSVFTVSFLVGSGSFFVFKSTLNAGFGALYRMFMYHNKHPYQYMGIVALVFSLVAVTWNIYYQHLEGKKRVLSILIALCLTVLVASIPGGILWKIHDMQAGYFSTGDQFRSDLVWGAKSGLFLGWLITLSSIPYNLIGILAGWLILDRIPRRISNQ